MARPHEFFGLMSLHFLAIGRRTQLYVAGWAVDCTRERRMGKDFGAPQESSGRKRGYGERHAISGARRSVLCGHKNQLRFDTSYQIKVSIMVQQRSAGENSVRCYQAVVRGTRCDARPST